MSMPSPWRLRNGLLKVCFLSLLTFFVLNCGGSGGSGLSFGIPSGGTGNTPLALTSSVLNDGEVGQAYTFSFVASGGQAPYGWAHISGNLPSGLSVSSQGVLSGTPFSSGTFNFEIRLNDASSPAQIITRNFSLIINVQGGGGPQNTPPSFTNAPSTQQLVHQTSTLYSFDFDASDPDGDPLSFGFVTPPINGTSNIDTSSGLFTWTPTIDGVYSITVSINDGNNPAVDYTFNVNSTASGTGGTPNQPPNITSLPGTQAFDGVSYSYQVQANDPDNDPVTWSLPQSPNGMSISGSGLITWLPSNADIATSPHSVQVQADDGQGNTKNQSFSITVSTNPGPSGSAFPPSVVLSNLTSGGSVTSQSFVRSWERLATATPTSHALLSGLGSGQFLNGSARLGLTGVQHNLRCAGDRAHEVKLNSVLSYIQCPSYSSLLPNDSAQTQNASCRLYTFTDLEDGTNPTGTQDSIVAVDTFSGVQTFNFNTNIHEEIYVPANFSDEAIFAVTADSGTQLWICRTDYREFSNNNSNMIEVDLSALGSGTVKHQTVTRAGDALWFSSSELSGDKLYYALIDASGQPPVATQVTLPTLTGTTPSKISTHFAASGDGEKIAICAGNDISQGITSASPLTTTLAGLWRDIWVVDGTLKTAQRTTLFETDRPGAGADVRLIEIFDSDSVYKEDYSASNANDFGSNDRRVVFGETNSTGNSTHVGHTINFDGSLVAFVLLETNLGNTDGTGNDVRDEVYVASVNSSVSIIRVTASPRATDPAGTGININVDAFERNMGVCTGLMFPSKLGTQGLDTRLFFSYGRFASGEQNEWAVFLYSSEFTSAPFAHLSTRDRITGVSPTITPPTGGFDISNPTNRVSMIVGSEEGASVANNRSLLTLVMLDASAQSTPPANAKLAFLDLTASNTNVSPGTNTVADVRDGAGNPIAPVYRLNNSQTLLSSGFDQPNPLGAGSNTSFPHLSSRFFGVTGPTSASVQSGDAFVVVESAQNVENLYVFSLHTGPVVAVDITNLVSAGRIHDVLVSQDGTAIAIHRGISTTADPSHRLGTTTEGSDVFLIPNRDRAITLNVTPSSKSFTAFSLGIASNLWLSRTGAWLSTQSITGTDTLEYWYADGTTAINSGLPESQLTLKRVKVERLVGSSTIGSPEIVDPGATPGSIVLYGAGEEP